MGSNADLYWNGQFVVALTDCTGPDWGWHAGDFRPGSFRKDLAEVLDWAWNRNEVALVNIDPEVGVLPIGFASGWTLRHSDAAEERIVALGSFDAERGIVEWR